MDRTSSVILSSGFVATAFWLICYVATSLIPIVNHTILTVGASMLFLVIALLLLDLIDG